MDLPRTVGLHNRHSTISIMNFKLMEAPSLQLLSGFDYVINDMKAFEGLEPYLWG